MYERIEPILPSVQKPARYTGGEFGSVVKDKSAVALRVAFCFPDTYEIGMSHLGLRILYGLLNEQPDIWCERAFAPWVDMETQMRARNLPLWALESGDSLSCFDLLAFTLQYELSYTNVLNMLSLAGLPLRAAQRTEPFPLVIAGGPCTANPEPMAPFIDLFVLGEGEEVTLEITALCIRAKRERWDKPALLRAAAQIQGVYVPSLYAVSYLDDGTAAAVSPKDNAPAAVTKRIVADLDSAYYPLSPLVPNTEVVHDRVMLELFRGCIRGCRFCQAGYATRPVRAKSPDVLHRQAVASCEHTGYDEIALSSLSTSDYRDLYTLCEKLLDYTTPRHVNLSLPSLRADSFSRTLLEQVQAVRKSGLTFAPEAGTARLRDVINKNLTEEDLLRACALAFEGGWSSIKLYFMLGLPTETDEDVTGIARLAHKVYLTWKQNSPARDRGVRISVSASCFVPKPHTPFQWERQATPEELAHKQTILRAALPKQVSFSWHDADVSFLEAVLARGDRRLADAVETAFLKGCRLDGWREFFSLDTWMQALCSHGLEPAFYAHRERTADEVLPWSHMDCGVTPKHLWNERQAAYRGDASPDCRHGCAQCGASDFLQGGVCDA